MKASLHETGPEAGANITLATNGKQVAGWLAGLALDDPLAAARALAEYLAAHDRPDMPAGLRRQLYDILAETIRRTLAALSGLLRPLRLPMDGATLERVDRAIALLLAVAEFHRRLLLEDAGRAPANRPEPGHYSTFLHACLEVMAVCHLSHRQLPAGFWRGVHQVGHRLVLAGLADAVDPARPPATLREPYLALLLEATADPYHLSEQERGWVLDIIARHGGLARVEPASAGARRGVFGIQAGQDRAPYPLSWQRVPVCDLVLDTTPLVRKLAFILSRLEAGRAPGQDVPVVRHPGYRELLKRLKLAWGASTQRTAPRHRPSVRSQRTILVGFEAVHRYLAEPSAVPEPTGMLACQLINESPGGMALQVARASLRLRIGSLVCICGGPGQARREVGLVRWFKTGGDGTLSFGIKFRHGQALPVFWQLPGEAAAMRALLMAPERGAGRQFIVPAQTLGQATRLTVRLGAAVWQVGIGGRIEATPDTEVYRCEWPLD